MNIIEATKSGKPFKREGWGSWVVIRALAYRRTDIINNDFSSLVTFSPVDIAADDWLIKEDAVSITPSQFWDAVFNARSDSDYNGVMLHRIAAQLGLSK